MCEEMREMLRYARVNAIRNKAMAITGINPPTGKHITTTSERVDNSRVLNFLNRVYHTHSFVKFLAGSIDRTKNNKNVGVVAGILFDGNKFLVEKRKPDEDTDPGIVCLPGGHVKTGESREEALKREMYEELGIIVKKAKFICKNFYVPNNGERHCKYYYLITEYEGNPVSNTAQDVFWLDDTARLDLEFDRKTIKKIKSNIR
jgi:8-oxo-dGTP pyrophosphatase MutT (NUDIX family)